MANAIALRMRPVHLVLAALAVLACIALAATLATARRVTPTEAGTGSPTGARLPTDGQISTTVVDEQPAPAKAARPQAARPAAQTGPAQAGEQGAASGGGDTNVTIDNGSSGTETESGGSHVDNSAAVSARTGSSDADP